DHWTEENPNPNAKYPKISQSTVFQISDRYVEDASFLRLKNVQLAYTLNLKKSFLNSVQLFVSGTNLLTFTQYSWFDPEVVHVVEAFPWGSISHLIQIQSCIQRVSM